MRVSRSVASVVVLISAFSAEQAAAQSTEQAPTSGAPAPDLDAPLVPAQDPNPAPVAARGDLQAPAPPPNEEPAPFSGDYTWMNGQSRQKEQPLKVLNGALTFSTYLDINYAYSLNHPRDNTLTGSASIGRSNEFQINLASVGWI